MFVFTAAKDSSARRRPARLASAGRLRDHPRMPLVTSDHAVAHHEAAHAVAAFTLGLEFVRVSAGADSHRGPVGAVELSPGQPLTEAVVVACLAGIASSETLLGSQEQEVAPEHGRARHDVETAGAMIRQLAGGDDERAESLFLELVEKAEELLESQLALWRRLTLALVAQPSLDRSDVVRLAAEEKRRTQARS
jgi:hypothetical protein